MMFDDRLATVLRSPVTGERAARTQFRQLLDLLGSTSTNGSVDLVDAAYARLGDLVELIPAEEQSRILREPGLRLRNRDLVAFLATGEPKPAAAALATARLTDAEWQALIPQLPMTARGFLRHRRDLPAGTRRVLDQLGVRDFVLPRPPEPPVEITEIARPAATEVEDDPDALVSPTSAEGIRSLLDRIEAFRSSRRIGTPSPPPTAQAAERQPDAAPDSFDFVTDTDARIVWASGSFAPLAEGLQLARPSTWTVASMSGEDVDRMRRQQVLNGAPLTIAGAPAIAGEWRIDAAPFFTGAMRSFAGYRGRIRRPEFRAAEAVQAPSAEADRMRQVLHELRTPVNAIQGFAEIIQQQLFGPAPNEYRALAAAVSVDSAKLLAAFEELDRLARLETGALELDEGDADLRDAVAETTRRLSGALAARKAGYALEVSGKQFATAMTRQELMVLCWRLLATLAGSLAPGEERAVQLSSDGRTARILAELPQAIADAGDPFAIGPDTARPAISAGMFGTGFALRLARAELIAAGGSLGLRGTSLEARLPVLAGPAARNGKRARDDNARRG